MPPKQLIHHDRSKKLPVVEYYILTMSSTGTIAWVCLSPITTQCEHTGCPVSLSKNSRGLLLCSGQPTAVSLLKNCTRDSQAYLIVYIYESCSNLILLQLPLKIQESIIQPYCLQLEGKQKCTCACLLLPLFKLHALVPIIIWEDNNFHFQFTLELGFQ